jgi:hypothetical protein
LRIGVRRDADFQRLDFGDQALAQFVGGFLADRHDNRQRHAAFAS